MVIESKLSRVFLRRRNLWRKVYCSCNCGVIMLRARRTTDAFSPIRRIRGLRGARFEANYVSRIDISFFFFFLSTEIDENCYQRSIQGGRDYRSFNAIFNNFSSFFFLSNLSRKCVHGREARSCKKFRLLDRIFNLTFGIFFII